MTRIKKQYYLHKPNANCSYTLAEERQKVAHNYGEILKFLSQQVSM